LDYKNCIDALYQIAFGFADNESQAHSLKIVLLKNATLANLAKEKVKKDTTMARILKLITCRYQAPHASIYNGNTVFLLAKLYVAFVFWFNQNIISSINVFKLHSTFVFKLLNKVAMPMQS
jgi:hypothetical protein